MEPSFSLKDELFNAETVALLVNALNEHYPDFDPVAFIDKCTVGFKERELKERMTYVCICLEEVLSDDYLHNTKLMLKTLHSLNTNGLFIFGSLCEYVERNGCNDEFIDHSLYMLGEYTKFFSSEFAIRKFINLYPEKTFAKMLEWSKSDDTDQRRLASEGLRPKLPWSIKIEFDYHKGILPLNNLYYDKVRYVTRSVANHLNDISKIDPDLVVERLKEWKASSKQEEKEMNYIINHSSRTLIKKGHKGALELQGYNPASKYEISNFEIADSKLEIGDYLQFSFDFKSLENAKYMIDYVIDYPMANQKRSQKVFKIKKLDLAENDEVQISKRHQFKMMTTKTWYTGEYFVSLQINGQTVDKKAFTLKV